MVVGPPTGMFVGAPCWSVRSRAGVGGPPPDSLPRLPTKLTSQVYKPDSPGRPSGATASANGASEGAAGRGHPREGGVGTQHHAVAATDPEDADIPLSRDAPPDRPLDLPAGPGRPRGDESCGAGQAEVGLIDNRFAWGGQTRPGA